MADELASTSFDDVADVVVVGFGSAGAAAAITAADLDASVVVVEKQDAESHIPSSRVAHIVMVVDDVDRAAAYLDRCSGGIVPSVVSRAWAERAHALPAWLERAGLRLEYVRGAQHPEFEGAEALRVCLAVRQDNDVTVERRADPYGVPFAPGQEMPDASEFFDTLAATALSRPDVRILWGSPARRLIQDADRRVIGVDTTEGRIRARHGVILSCGGYEFDEDLKLNYLKGYPVHFYGTPANTGDGVRMAQAVGADLWHMNQMLGRGIGHFELEDGKVVNGIMALNPPGYVVTDKYGERFADEFGQAKIIEHSFYFELLNYDRIRRDFTRIPSYWLFDQSRLDAGPIGIATGAFAYAWSGDNSVELERGWIAQGGTVAEAAAAAGILDPEAAARSVEDYNRGCAEGVDAFGRPLDTLVPLETPPYYCVPLYPGGPNTCGGPRRDEHARILDPFGDPIAGLFGAGELGEPIGLLYPSSGSNLSEALAFGQIAAETALAGRG